MTPHFPHGAAPAAELNVERLPFTVRLIRSHDDLLKAVEVRHDAYARHVPAFAETLRTPEAYDTMDGAAVLLAESKLDGTPLGSMRIQTNLHGPLALERSVTLPEHLQHATLAEATRLGVARRTEGLAVKTVLFKAFFLYCQQQQIDWMVITARAPIDRQYERLLFSDVDPTRGYVPLPHVGNLPHRILCLEVSSVERLWGERRHPLFDFFFHTQHVDIDLGEPPRIAHTAARPAAAAPMPHMAM
ncbi:N-acyl amino acid synthase FeeM domain-containing protein [Pseudorhodoferax sp.]|uniref:N-acyl amino acid synthase FeeM domain-containing protein n=1 Tax=Pseudorhodoferax sp. TaxID=1993553 RepID=UPI0039E3D6AD